MTLHGISLGDQPFEYVVPSESEAGKSLARLHAYRALEVYVSWASRTRSLQAYSDGAGISGRDGRRSRTGRRGRSCSWRERIDNSPSLYTERTSKVDCEDPRARDYPISGLLAMAHEQGLIELKAEFIAVTDTLALAAAYAVFKDGWKFWWDAADATPNNVRAQVKAHFARMALTRAKARALRDALNIGMVSLEELGGIDAALLLKLGTTWF